MVDALGTSGTPRLGVPGYQPPEAQPAQRATDAPSFSTLVAEAHAIAKSDQLPISGHVVFKGKRSAKHRHAVWLIGPFALLQGGWFGQVLGAERTKNKAPRWLRRHERRCHDQHWTQFRWFDEASLEIGCGDAGVGLGLEPDGPIYCALTAGNGNGQHTHLPLAILLRDGLRELAALR